jgi:hypothetical protein
MLARLALLIRGRSLSGRKLRDSPSTRKTVQPCGDAIEDSLLHFSQVPSQQIPVTLQGYSNQLASSANFGFAKELL